MIAVFERLSGLFHRHHIAKSVIICPLPQPNLVEIAEQRRRLDEIRRNVSQLEAEREIQIRESC